MIVGSLGTVIFQCSSFYTKTINNLSKNISARWLEHKVIGSKPKLQFDGVELDQLKFSIHLNAAWKVNPLAAAKELENYLKQGKKLKFFLGGKKVGNGTYIITNISEEHRAYSAIGTVTKIDLSLELKEYN
ncbi:MAG: phage tail protein [Fusobacterium mortiferum]|jgi:phage protein U|uniref:phage tail protein n=1 Tax=Fusobacterium mortiferum TaxID=850 RepID=UPI00158E41CE|nr:phage tail protein [Fusobacterium mortiferum]MCI6383321.1 phage tail protein [Fusobacterium mortiferum]DAP91399.1 MAG TPA: hypothetical protein [Caudoviricetes sp.]